MSSSIEGFGVKRDPGTTCSPDSLGDAKHIAQRSARLAEAARESDRARPLKQTGPDRGIRGQDFASTA